MPNFISENLNARLEVIKEHVRNLWNQHTGPPWHTFHDSSHNQKVEDMLYRLIPAEKYDQLSDEESFYLLASAWLHDVGMIINLFGKADDFKIVRSSHHNRSADYIKQNRAPLGLDHLEASIVSEICRYHRKKTDINACEEMVGTFRIRLLSAYLRLSDALHIDSTRVNEGRYRLLLAAGMPWESRFHWMKSKWVQSIIPDLDNMKIIVSVFDMPDGSPRHGLLPQLVEDEIREELDTMRDILIRGKVSYFLDIETKIIGMPLDENDRIELEVVLSNIELENLSSATEVANSIINTVVNLAEPKPETYKVIQDYLSQLKGVLKARPCHILIQNILKKMKTATLDDNLSDDVAKNRVKQIRADLESDLQTRKANLAALAENARPFLLDGSSILLFGYSTIVLGALKKLPSEVKERTPIYVAECRGKTRYSQSNEVRYCDGLNYAVQVRKAGFIHVSITPDICIGNLMARELIGKVVFGANGIDSTGRFGHTAGHLSIADLAAQNKVPIYVISITAKFGKLDWHANLERDVQWLSRDKKTLSVLEMYKIRTVNPREDIVDPDKIDMLITEVGAFPPTRIPEFIKSRIED